jgi:hypothetical protein
MPGVVLLLWHLLHVWSSEILPVERQLTQLIKSGAADHGTPHQCVGSSPMLRCLAMQLRAMMNTVVCSTCMVQQCRHHTQNVRGDMPPLQLRYTPLNELAVVSWPVF